MLVQLSHPNRQIEIKGPKRTKDLLRELNLVMEAHLVIRGDELVTEDEILADGDQVEIKARELNTEKFIDEKVREIQEKVGDGKAINALSGGVDSSTVLS